MTLPTRHQWFAALLVAASIQSALARESVDLLVTADHVITMAPESAPLANAGVAIRDGKIIAVASTQALQDAYEPQAEIRTENQVLLPGLINGHTHAAMTLFRGIADDLALMEWLTKYIFPAEIRFVDEDFVRIGTELACLEMIKGGTTAFVDMYFHPDQVADVVDRCGLRAVVSASIIEQESGYTKSFADAMSKGEGFVRRWTNKNSRVTPALAAHAAYTVRPENLRRVRALAAKLGAPVSTHLAESQSETQIVTSMYGKTSVHLMNDINFFSGTTIAAHVVWPTPEEIGILAAKGVGAVHNPTSNLKIAAGISPVPEMLDAGVAVGLGTDGAASNNDLDMWDEIRLAAYIHKVRLDDPKVMPAATVLGMATRTGAKAIGLGEQVGSLETGKQADMILVSLAAPHLTPMYDVVSHLVYAVDAQDVQTVIVDGQVVMRDREVLTLDESAVKDRAIKLAAEIAAARAEPEAASAP